MLGLGAAVVVLLLVVAWWAARSTGGAPPDAFVPGPTALDEARAVSGEPPRAPDGVGRTEVGALAAVTAPAASRKVAGSAPPAYDAGADETPRDAAVSGRVVDATGGPVPGATVRVRFMELALARLRQGTFSRAPDAEWIADTEGRFEGLAPIGRVSLVASAEAYADSREIARAPARDLVLVLAPGGRVTGRVQRTDGSPVSGATLQIKPRGFEQQPIDGASDERGEFSIGGVPAGVVGVTASAPGLSSAHEWLRLTLAEVAAPLVFTLGAAHGVHGVVRIPGGSPCTAGMVRLGGKLQQAMIDPRGNYRIEGLDDGTHELTVTCPGTAVETRTIAVTAQSPSSVELNWQLAAGLSLAGSVRRKNGEPMVGTMVWANEVAAPEGTSPASKTDALVGNAGSSCNTDARGEFECRSLRAGWYRVSTGSAAAVNARSDPVRVDAETKSRVELVVPDSGEVRVRIADGEGTNGLLALGVFARGEKTVPATPRGDRFVFEDLALGRYRIAFGRAASEPSPSAVDVELTSTGQIIDVELRAPEMMTISGNVVEPNGAPVPEAWVHVSVVEPGYPLPRRAADPVLTNMDGRFAIGELPPGRYAVAARHANGEARPLDVSAGQRDVRLVIDPYGSLSGRVTGADGEPARRFSVVVFQDTPGEALDVDGDRGRWSLPWVAPGEYRVVFMSPSGGASTNARVTSGSDTALTVELDPALAGQAISSAMKRR